MKNIFKLLGIALVACTFCVACGDDDESTTSNGIAVTFGNTSWNAQDVLVDPYSQALYELGAFKDYDDEDAPSIDGYFIPLVANTVFTGNDGDFHYFFYFENDYDYVEDTEYPTWQPQAGMTTNITEIDLTALTLSGAVAGIMKNAAEAMAGEENPTEKDMTITITNANWEAATAKGKTLKNHGQIAKM